MSKGKEVEKEEIKPVLKVVTMKEEGRASSVIQIKDYSSKRRLLGVTVRILRFIRNCRVRDKISEPFLTIKEIKEAVIR